MPINWGVIREQIIEASVVAVNATALNTAERARQKAPVRKIFAGGRQTVRFKTAAEVEGDRELFARLGLKPEILAVTGGRLAASRGINPKRSKRIGGEEFGFARTVEHEGRTHNATVTRLASQRTAGGTYYTRVQETRTHKDRPRNLRNRANEFRATQEVRLLNPLNYAELRDEDAEKRLTARGRYELASQRAVSERVRINENTGRPVIVARIGGALRDSIRVERASADMFPVIKASVVAGGGKVTYARHQELGNRHNPAHPFLRPSLNEAREELPAQLLRSLRRLGR